MPVWVYYWAGMRSQEQGFSDETVSLGEELQKRSGENGDGLGEAIGFALQSQGIDSRCASEQEERSCHLAARDLAQKALSRLDASQGTDRYGAHESSGVRSWILNRLGVTNQAVGNIGEAIRYYEGALEIRRALGTSRGVSSTLSNLGAAYTEGGQSERAKTAFTESLGLAALQGNRWTVYVVLIGLADLAVAQGELSRAAKLLGAADAFRAKYQFDLYVHWKAAYERTNRAIGRSSEHRQAWQEGQQLSFDDAVAFASISWS